jgi:hypothetical protein
MPNISYMTNTIHAEGAQSDPGYHQAKKILQRTEMGRKRLANVLHVRNVTARKYIEKYRGETQGPPADSDYDRVDHLKQLHPDWGRSSISEALSLSLDRTKLLLARWQGVQLFLASSGGASAPPQASPPEIPVSQSTAQCLDEEIEAEAPVLPPRVQSAARQGLLEILFADIHVGLQAWGAQSGRNYNPVIAAGMFKNALHDLLQKSSSLKPERLVLVVGGDLFNVDGSTFAGPDDAMPLAETFYRSELLLVYAINLLRQVAPVDVIMVPGNHDTNRLYYLGRVLRARFQNVPGVSVDASPGIRKYYSYGNRVLLGYSHGNNVSHRDLPLIMAQERPQEWGKSWHRAWGVGHYHGKETKIHMPKDPSLVTYQVINSVAIRIIPSLCPTGAWAHSMGYSSKPAAEAYFWSREAGCTHIFIHNAP